MFIVQTAVLADAAAILALQKLAFQSEARRYNDWSIPPLTQSLESLSEEFGDSQVLKATLNGQLVGSVRAKVTADVCAIGGLMVHPDFQGRGVGSRLLRAIEGQCGPVARYELFTGAQSEPNIRLYRRHGYVITHTRATSPTMSLACMEKIPRVGPG
jgi:ribosomal protein S18 acetylase RimI-like enzyme